MDIIGKGKSLGVGNDISSPVIVLFWSRTKSRFPRY